MSNKDVTSSTGTEHARFRDREEAVKAARQNGKTERRTITCPKCGEGFRNLPNHLVSCDGGSEADRDV